MDKPNGTTGDKNTEQNLAPSDQLNTFHFGQHNFESGDKFSHSDEHRQQRQQAQQQQQQQQQKASADLTRRETEQRAGYEFAGSIGSQLKPPSESYLNEPRRPQWNEPATRAAQTRSPTDPGRWFEWAHTFGDGLKSNKSFNAERPDESPSGDGTAQDSSREEKETGSLKKLLKMAQSHYLISILCLLLVVLACLTASFVISRAIGDLDVATDATRDGAGQQLRQALESPLEVRTIELVDLMESGKTFAYVRWRVNVLVPKSSAIYKQQRPVAGASSLNQMAKLETKANSALANDSTLNSITNQRNTITQAGTDWQLEKSATQQVETTQPNPDADPIELAASELRVRADTMNSTLVDCFLVDTEKRIEQKRAAEARHITEASTRRVDFKSMMYIIQACRSLSLSSLPIPLGASADQQSEPNLYHPATETLVPKAERAPEARLPPMADQRPSIDQQGKPNSGQRKASSLDEVIVPVERPIAGRKPVSTERPVSDGNDASPLVLLFDSLVTALTHPGATNNANNRDAVVQPPPYEVTKLNKRDVSNAVLAKSDDNRERSELARPASTRASDNNLIEPPSNHDDEARRASYVSMGMSMMSGIVPNTLWCGLGDRARNYSELGSEFQVDACCRAHDHCPIRLKPFSADYQLINWSMSTRSHCDCDLDFNDCLSAINSTLSNVIKTLYFRFVGLQCIDLDGRHESNPLGLVMDGDTEAKVST